MIDWLDIHGVEALIAGLLGLILWNLRRFIATQDGHGKRITALETDRVTSNDMDELRHSLMATATQNQMQTELRLDAILLHLAGGKK